MLSKEDKLEMLQLLGQAINNKGGLAVQGTMIGEGGFQMVVQPVERVTSELTEVFQAINTKIDTINAGLPARYTPTENYRYVFNKTVPWVQGIWRLADVNAKLTLPNALQKLYYIEQLDELVICMDSGSSNTTIAIYDATTYTEKYSFEVNYIIQEISVSIDGERMLLYTDSSHGRYAYIYNKSFGVYVLAQQLDMHTYNTSNNYGAVAMNLTGDRIVRVSGYYGNSSNFVVQTYVLDKGKFVRVDEHLIAQSYAYAEAQGQRSITFTPDGKYVFVHINYYNRNYTYQLEWDGSKYVKTTNIVHNITLASTIGRRGDILVSTDIKRIVLSDTIANATYILKEASDISLYTDPFNDNSMIIKYFANDNLKNFVNANTYEMSVVTGTLTYAVEYNWGKSLVFDGATELRIPNTHDLETQNFTWTFNIKTAAHTDDNYILANISTDSEGKGRGIKIAEKNGNIVVYHGSGDGSWESVTDLTNIADGNYHAVGVSITNGGTISIYIDGLLTTETTVSPATISYNNSVGYISVGAYGANYGNDSVYGEHHLNLLTYFNRPLNSNEHKAVATQTLPQPGKYVIEESLYRPNGDSGGAFGIGIASTYSLSTIWVADRDGKTIYRYAAKEAVTLVDTFDTQAGWTLDAASQITGGQLVLDHTSADNEASHSLNQLARVTYNVTLEFPNYSGNDENYQVKVQLGDTVHSFKLNDQGANTIAFDVTDDTDKTVKIFTDTDCTAAAYHIDKITIVEA
jgi:hypothetical protein